MQLFCTECRLRMVQLVPRGAHVSQKSVSLGNVHNKNGNTFTGVSRRFGLAFAVLLQFIGKHNKYAFLRCFKEAFELRISGLYYNYLELLCL